MGQSESLWCFYLDTNRMYNKVQFYNSLIMGLSKLIKMYCIYIISVVCLFILMIWSSVTHETLEIQKLPDNIFVKLYNTETFIYTIISLNLVYFYYFFKNKTIFTSFNSSCFSNWCYTNWIFQKIYLIFPLGAGGFFYFNNCLQE
jgi:hypothetical protein